LTGHLTKVLGDKMSRRETVCIVGAGWYGCETAKKLKAQGYDVTVIDKNSGPMQGISGTFGVRAHRGPHYPRSSITRAECQKNLDEFKKAYPDLINENQYSIYGLGYTDAANKPSKVDLDTFKKVCHESGFISEIDIANSKYRELQYAANINEPSIPVGKRLATKFQKELAEAGVTVRYNCVVEGVEKKDDTFVVKQTGDLTSKFDHFVNATSFQSLLPKGKLPLGMNVVYQPCTALVYKDKKPGPKPISFIVMAGWYPCILPYDDRLEDKGPASDKYIVTHGKWTIMGSHKTPEAAYEQLSGITDEFIENEIKLRCEEEMNRYWPEFRDRFEYQHRWESTVVAKIQTEKEYRSAATVQDERGIIYIVPGKITEIKKIAKEVLRLIRQKNVIRSGNYRYINNGTLHKATSEITEPLTGLRNTCDLQTANELLCTRPKAQHSTFSTPSLNTQTNNQRQYDSLFILSILVLGVLLLYFSTSSSRTQPNSSLFISNKILSFIGFTMVMSAAYKLIVKANQSITFNSAIRFFRRRRDTLVDIETGHGIGPNNNEEINNSIYQNV